MDFTIILALFFCHSNKYLYLCSIIENTDDNGRQGIQTARQYGVVRQRGYIGETQPDGQPSRQVGQGGRL